MRDEYNEQVVKRLHHATKTTTHARLTSRAFGIDTGGERAFLPPPSHLNKY